MQPWGVDDDQLGVRTGDDAAHRPPGGLRFVRGDRDLLADHGVEQSGLSGVRLADEAGEAGSVFGVGGRGRIGGPWLLVIRRALLAAAGEIPGRRHTCAREWTVP